MTKPTIYIAIPCYDHMDVSCRHSLDRACRTCQTAVTEVHYAVGDSMISRVRNNQISEFWDESEAPYFMTIDSDLELKNVTAEDNLFDKLLAADKDIVGGLYAKKSRSNFRCASVPMDDQHPEYDTGLVEMQWLSTGCMMVKREVVKALTEAEPAIMYHGDGEFLGKPRYALYQPGIAEIERGTVWSELQGENIPAMFRKYLSEDWAFNLRCHAAGFQTWADTSILLTHWGRFGYKLWDV